MCKLKGLLILVCATQFMWAQGTPDLPAGPMQAKVRTSCTECHDAGIIVQQRLSKAAWVKEVDKMIKWGAVVEPADHDSYVDYLSSSFPADKPPAAGERTAAGKQP